MRRSNNTCGSCICCFLFVAIIIVATYLIINYATNGKANENVQKIIPDSLQNRTENFWEDLFGKEDPFAGLNDTHAWEQVIPGVGGLNITILNALDDKWHTYFDTATSEWDAGTPDSLTILTEVVEPDMNCSSEPGYIKVCNGNYGDTSWKGINQILMDDKNGYIYSSTALMNEYYLTDSTSEDDKQYTMCHEIGHGFGLPHTDEDFNNRNEGDCLDYTLFPKSNKHPGTINYEILAKVYGEVGSTSSSSSSSPSSSSSTLNTNVVTSSTNKEVAVATSVLDQTSQTQQVDTHDTTTTSSKTTDVKATSVSSLFDVLESYESHDDNNHNQTRRNLRQHHQKISSTNKNKNTLTNQQIMIDNNNEINDIHREAFNDIHSYFTNSNNNQFEEHITFNSRKLRRQLTLLHENHFRQIYRYDIGNDHFIQVTVLLAT